MKARLVTVSTSLCFEELPVSIVFGYGLDDQAVGVLSQAGVTDFSSNLCVQTCSEAHPASCTICNGGPFPGAKRGRGVTLTTHPHLVPMSGMSRSYTSSPPSACVVCSGTALICFFCLFPRLQRRREHTASIQNHSELIRLIFQ
jgi:hypothetical protein